MFSIHYGHKLCFWQRIRLWNRRKILRKHLEQMGKVFTQVLSATVDRSKLHQRRIRHFAGRTLNVRHILCARAQMQRAFHPFHNVSTSAWHGFQTGQVL